jgi:uncharacterized protein YfaS (alpha-2-macroglobulin family)
MSSIKVFQDFFTELDLPVTLTQGDQVSLPVAVYNYSGKRGEVRLKLTPDDWFSLSGDAPEKSLFVENDRVGGSQFTLQAKRIGKFKLTLKAELEGSAKRADIVIREIEVVPNGHQQTITFNGRVENSVEHAVVPVQCDSGRWKNLRSSLPRSAEPSGRGYGRHSPNALWLLRANLFGYLSKRAGARLYAAD